MLERLLSVGQHTREQIAEKLGGEVPFDYIDFVINRLKETGYLTEAVPELTAFHRRPSMP